MNGHMPERLDLTVPFGVRFNFKALGKG
jgi:hypothetical protein